MKFVCNLYNIYYDLLVHFFHSIMEYGLIFWGNSSYSCKIFRLWKG